MLLIQKNKILICFDKYYKGQIYWEVCFASTRVNSCMWLQFTADDDTTGTMYDTYDTTGMFGVRDAAD